MVRDYRSEFARLTSTERVVLIIDTSPSMDMADYPPSRLEAAKNAAKEFIGRKFVIDERDEVAIVSFSGRPKRRSKPVPVGKSRKKLSSTIESMNTGGWLDLGGTAIGDALRESARVLGVNLDGKRKWSDTYVYRIVLLSDGENNIGTNPVEVAEKLKKAGVIINAVGIGKLAKWKTSDERGLNEKDLMAIASPDRYCYISDVSNLFNHFRGMAEKVMTIDPSEPVEAVKKTQMLGIQSFKNFLFTRRYVRRLKKGSIHIGEQCLNERTESYKFQEGDTVVFCPQCGRPHHIDCWIWNSNRCYGGSYPCPGRGVPIYKDKTKDSTKTG